MTFEQKQPELVLVAGPNGSGKSTVADNYILPRFPVWPKLNADRVAAVLALEPPSETKLTDQISLDAANLIDQTARCLSLLGEPFVLETVLSSNKYRPLVAATRRVHLTFRLVYVTTHSSEINVERVRQRVLQGGHDVPVQSIRDRWIRSMTNLPWFAQRADRLVVFDNSAEQLTILALRKLGGSLEIRDRGHPASKLLQTIAGQPTINDDAQPHY